VTSLSLRFSVLGSGSTGNATVVEACDHGGSATATTTRLLIDCGLTLHQLTRRLAARGLTPTDLDAVFVTHEHADHVGCLASLMRKHALPVITSSGTWQAAERRIAGLQAPAFHAQAGQPLNLGLLQLSPLAVPHDAAEPLQLVVQAGHRRLGVVTDLGHAPASLAPSLMGCHSLVLETNHDEAMLAAGPYPAFLRRRIAGHLGHLANHQSTELLQAAWHPDLTRVVAAHLSRHNNSSELALACVRAGLTQGAAAAGRDALAQRVEVVVADAVEGTGWLTV
jgi:phosphoribosyl 1,2-cyclic phosphodiesterase